MTEWLRQVQWAHLPGFVLMFALSSTLLGLGERSLWYQPEGTRALTAPVSLVLANQQGMQGKLSLKEIEQLGQTHLFRWLHPYRLTEVVLGTGGQTQPLRLAVAPWSLLRRLGVSVNRGRLPEPHGEHNQIVLSPTAARALGGLEPGQLVHLPGGVSLQVTGLLNPEFTGINHEQADGWISPETWVQHQLLHVWQAEDADMQTMLRVWLNNQPAFAAFGELAGLTRTQAQIQLERNHSPEALRLDRQGDVAIGMDTGQAGMRYLLGQGLDASPTRLQQMQRILSTMATAFLLLCLVVLSSYALWLMARIERQAADLAVHLLVGCTRRDLFVHMLKQNAPTIVLALLLALPVAQVAQLALTQHAPFSRYLQHADISLTANLTLLAFALFVTVLAAILQTRLSMKLAHGRTQLTLASRHGRWLMPLLASIQMLLASLVLALALHHMNRLQQGTQQHIELRLRGLHMTRLQPADEQPADLPGLEQALTKEGLTRPAFADAAPYDPLPHLVEVVLEEHPPLPVQRNRVSRNFFEWLGMPLLAGRVNTHPRGDEVVIQASLARHWFKHPAQAVGKTLFLNSPRGQQPYTIVAVSADLPYDNNLHNNGHVVYPLYQDLYRASPERMLLKSQRGRGLLQQQVQQVLAALGLKPLPLHSLQHQQQQRLHELNTAFRAALVLAMVVGLVALQAGWQFSRYYVRQLRWRLALLHALGATSKHWLLEVGPAVAGIALFSALLMAVLWWLQPAILAPVSPRTGLAMLAVLLVLFCGMLLWQLARLGRSHLWPCLQSG